MNLSKSQYIRGLQCPKSLWLYKHKRELTSEPDQQSESNFKVGHQVGEIVKELFPNGIEIEFDANDFKGMLKKTSLLIANNTPIIYEAAFSHNGTFVMADLLIKNGSVWDVYEVKASTGVKEYHINDLSIQWHVISRFITIGKAYVVHINNKYIRQGTLDIQQLFFKADITKLVKAKQNDIKTNLAAFASMLEQDEPNIAIGTQCSNPYDCQFIDHCWKAIPTPSVFDLYRLNTDKKFEFHQQGITSFDDLKNTSLSKTQELQISTYQSKKTHVEPKRLKQFLAAAKFPINFLDFETFQNAIPRFKEQRPYMQMPFQYSLHILHKDGTLEHKEFLGDEQKDPRVPLSKQLIKDISSTGSIIAYNQPFEIKVIQDLAELDSRNSTKLLKMTTRFIDLITPFRGLMYYHPDFNGSFSIKSVLPALFPNDIALDYNNLAIQNGSMAMDTFANLHLLKDKNQVTQIRHDLLAYCHLDTLAMVRIWRKLCNITNQQEDNMGLKQDGEFVRSLMEEFFKQKNIKKRLEFFNSYEKEDRLKGWETWWQIEFSYFIDEHPDVAMGDWHRESSYEIDQRTALAINDGKTKAYIDFAIRKKGSAIGEYIGIELKQARDFHKCTTQMVKDFIKISSIKTKGDDLKSIWCVGMFLEDMNIDDIKDESKAKKIIIKNLEDNADFELKEKDIQFSKIKGTDYTMVFF